MMCVWRNDSWRAAAACILARLMRLHHHQAEEEGLLELLQDMVLCWSPLPDKWVYSVPAGSSSCSSAPIYK